MECPDCKIELTEEHTHGLTIDVCPSCKAIWFDRGELEAYQNRPTKDQISKLGGSTKFKPKNGIPAPCPRCSTNTLKSGKIRGFEVGHCSNCQGVWVNPRKLKSFRKTGESTAEWFLPDIVLAALEIFIS